MKWVFIVLGALAALVALAAAIGGFLLPREHRAASRITLRQPAEAVWGVIRNPAALQGVWKDLKSARRVDDPAGREVWEEDVSGFLMRLIVAEETRPVRLVMQVDAPPDASFGGRWVYQIEPTEGGTRVTIAEEGWIGNPIFRVMGSLGGLHRSVDGYLRALGARLGETVEPVHVQ